MLDMSPKAIEARLRRVSELRTLCLALARAGDKAGLNRRSQNLPHVVKEAAAPYGEDSIGKLQRGDAGT